MILGIDVGGTFTDAVLLEGGRVHTAKLPSTPRDQSEGVIAAALAVLELAGRGPREIERFALGMTVATNALLEGRAARTALIATEGFEDIVELGRQNRPELYRLCATRPAPLVPPERRFGAPERTTPDGVLRPLEPEALAKLAADVAACEPEAVAIVLLHSYRHPEHERAIAAALSPPTLPAHVSQHISYESVGTFREYERAATTEVDAALSPLLAGYLQRLRERCTEHELREPVVMQSNGGLIDANAAARHAAWTVLSGPAGGAAAAAAIARAAGAERVLCFDMGGTSCDVCVIDDGVVHEREQSEIAGRPLALPMLAIDTVGAGGGSIAWRDAGGALRVGPESAGADPGPACYGRGGTAPTVTDANLLLGHLSADVPLAGGLRLDLRLAERAVASLASELGLSGADCAEGILRVANSEMVRALRVATVQRGVDPRGYALMPFGGAGPLHAAAVADELGIREVLCPLASGVLAALGLAAADRRRDTQRSVLLRGAALSAEAIAAATGALARDARAALGEQQASVSATYMLRYVGQSFELPVRGPLAADPAALRAGFDAAHSARYGMHDPEGELELVTIRVSATAPGPVRQAPARAEQVEPIAGPALVPLPHSTLVVPAGWTAERRADLIRMRRA